MTDHPFDNHEIRYFSKFDFVGNHETVTSTGNREDLPDRIKYHFKSDKVVAYVSGDWGGYDTNSWLFSPFVDHTMINRTEILWTL